MQAPGLHLKFPVLPGWQGLMPALPRIAVELVQPVGEPRFGSRPPEGGPGALGRGIHEGYFRNKALPKTVTTIAFSCK